MPANHPAPAHERHYAAFISYRHADNKGEGRRWAEWLHHALETYEVPRDLVGKPDLRGQPIPPSLYPIFRDEEELPADADLSENIHRALEHSETLIVLCSPRACESRFVADEIRIFKELGKGERILALMIDGEPNATGDPAKHAAGIGPEQECLPEPLRFGAATPGRPGESSVIDWRIRTEPIAADARIGGRPEQGYTSASAYRTALEKEGRLTGAALRREIRAYADRLELARLKVTAGVLAVPLGMLRRRDVVYRARKLRRLVTVFGTLTLLALAGAFLALWQSARAQSAERQAREGQAREEVQRRKAEDQVWEASRTAHTSGERLVAAGSWREGMAHLVQALRYRSDNRPAAAELATALRMSQGDRDDDFLMNFCEGRHLVAADLSADGQSAWAVDDTGEVWLWPSVNGRWPSSAKTVQHFSLPEEADSKTILFAPATWRLLVPGKTRGASLVDFASTPPRTMEIPFGAPVQHCAFSPDGTVAALCSGTGEAVVVDWKDSHVLYGPVKLTDHVDSRDQLLFFDAASLAYLSRGSHPVAWEFAEGKAPAELHRDSKEIEDNTSTYYVSPAGNAIVIIAPTLEALMIFLDHKDHKWLKLGPQIGTIVAGAWSADGSRFALGDGDGHIGVWDGRSGSPVEGPQERKLAGEIASLAWSADGHRLLASAYKLSRLYEWIWNDEGKETAGERAMPEPPTGLRVHDNNSVWIETPAAGWTLHGRRWLADGPTMSSDIDMAKLSSVDPSGEWELAVDGNSGAVYPRHRATGRGVQPRFAIESGAIPGGFLASGDFVCGSILGYLVMIPFAAPERVGPAIFPILDAMAGLRFDATGLLVEVPLTERCRIRAGAEASLTQPDWEKTPVWKKIVATWARNGW